MPSYMTHPYQSNKYEATRQWAIVLPNRQGGESPTTNLTAFEVHSWCDASQLQPGG